jgi:hypothetical protein
MSRDRSAEISPRAEPAPASLLDELLEPVVTALLPVVENEAEFARAAKAALVYAARYESAVSGKLLKETFGDLTLSKSYVSRHGRETATIDFLTVVHRVFSDLGGPATLNEVLPLLPKLRRSSELELVLAAVARGFLLCKKRGGGLPDQYEANPNARYIPRTRDEQVEEVRESVRCFLRAAVAQVRATDILTGTAGSVPAAPKNARLTRTEFHAPSDMDPRIVNEIVLGKLREAMEQIDAARDPHDPGKLVRVTAALQTAVASRPHATEEEPSP